MIQTEAIGSIPRPLSLIRAEAEFHFHDLVDYFHLGHKSLLESSLAIASRYPQGLWQHVNREFVDGLNRIFACTFAIMRFDDRVFPQNSLSSKEWDATRDPIPARTAIGYRILTHLSPLR